MGDYHLRRVDKVMSDEAEMLEVIRGQKHMTLAMCHQGQPYLVTMNYVFDESRRRFYFHCAHQGKKIDYLRASPSVWGQVLDDRGYLAGECNHAFRTVQFRGEVSFLSETEEKRRALLLMIDQVELDPPPVRRRFIEQKSLANVAIGCVQVLDWSGKKSPAETPPGRQAN